MQQDSGENIGSWRGLMQVFAPVEAEDISKIYDYDS
jgi:hypothetical protein